MDKRIPHLALKIRMIIVLSVIVVLLSIYYFLISHYAVRVVTVEGNMHYSAQEIKAMVLNGRWGDNSIYLSLKYKNKEIQNIPFIETMNIEIVSNDTIKITVYEKLLAGYVEYLGRYMYFDNEGTVVEVSKVKTNGIPQVTGLEFEYIELYEKIPVENNEIFKNILTITKLLTKYNLSCEKITFDRNNNVTLGYGDVKVYIGKLENIEDKIMQLPYILPKLKGKKGILDLQNYSKDGNTITFEGDNIN